MEGNPLGESLGWGLVVGGALGRNVVVGAALIVGA